MNLTPAPTPAPTPMPVSVAITTAAEVLENEEVQRTRVFIRLGWIASLSGIGAVPFVESTRPMVIYRCLTGRVPFVGNDMASILYSMVHDAPLRPSGLATLPTDVDRVLAIALAKEKSDRFATAPELAEVLAQGFANRLAPSLRVAADALIRQKPWRELDVEPPTRELAAGAGRIPGT